VRQVDSHYFVGHKVDRRLALRNSPIAHGQSCKRLGAWWLWVWLCAVCGVWCAVRCECARRAGR
jgi:hypothetical protein